MSETPRIIYRPLLGISAEQARDSRAGALEFIFATYREKAFVEKLPDELKIRPQWVNWRLEKRGGNLTKVPYTPGAERKASSTDLMTWGTFEEAIELLDRYDGVGFVFSSADPYTGIDLDDCVEQKTGVIKQWALEIVRYFDSYSELSATGCGVHIIVKGEVPNRRKAEIEVYSSKRFFTMTGHVLGEGGD